MSWLILAKTDDKKAPDIFLSAFEECEIITPRVRSAKLSYKEIHFGCFLDINKLSHNIYEFGYGGFGQNTIKFSREKHETGFFKFENDLKKTFQLLSGKLSFVFTVRFNPEHSELKEFFSHPSTIADMDNNHFYVNQNYFLGDNTKTT